MTKISTSKSFLTKEIVTILFWNHYLRHYEAELSPEEGKNIEY